jgi:hypothetical protein
VLRRPLIHPILFAIAPILYFYGNNYSFSNTSEIFFPIFVNVGIVVTAIVVSFIFSKNWQKAGIEGTVIIFEFATFGHVLFLALKNGVFWSDVRPLIIFYLIFFIIATWLNFRIFRNHFQITEFLNVVSIILMLFSIINIIPKWLDKKPTIETQQITEIPTPANLPDIYYIILDGYGGDEMLSEVYNFDNSSFLTELEEMGFFIANSSFTNYIRTVQSLNSTLNMQYLKNDNDWDTNLESINNNYLKDQLKYFGYTIYTIPNAFRTTNWIGEITTNKNAMNTKFFWNYMSTTAVVLFWNSVPYDIHRLDILNQFNSIENLVKKQGPKFVFVHIIAPHPPFVFDKNGNAIHYDKPYSAVDADDLGLLVKEYQSKYIGQLQFINIKAIETIESILKNSATSPIIIIQGDHGPGSMLSFANLENNNCLYERFSILNAYYFPDKNNNLYDDISPVNSFRLILNDYFGFSLDLLEDKAFYSTNSDYNEKSEVTQSIRSKICSVSP